MVVLVEFASNSRKIYVELKYIWEIFRNPCILIQIYFTDTFVKFSSPIIHINVVRYIAIPEFHPPSRKPKAGILFSIF